MDVKQFKDPIYGYIEVPSEYVKNIIDTNVFQRLRRVVQTSYAPLYPSAVHSRFVHSIGVFYLGTIASNRLLESIANNASICESDDWRRISDIFLLACLLHDVGHAPFSHTGETFYLDNKSENGRYKKLHELLCNCVNTDTLRNDIPSEDIKAAAPHEIMSAIIGIKSFASYFNNDFEKEFFARCITGYKFSDDYEKNSVYNSFVSLLNSKVIDVDRLDYLIRDAYFTGFETVNIDYNRLLNSLTIVEKSVNVDNEEKAKFEVGYKKNAISIIENVVYAHDAERKWIQTHPAVLYDMYIIQHILNGLDKTFSNDSTALFSLETLSPEGGNLADNLHISLLCDDDIVYLLKAEHADDLYDEFFSRNKRKHPLWKSESEYKAYLSLNYSGNALIELNQAIAATEKYVRKYTDSWVITKDTLEKVKIEVQKVENSNDTTVDAKTREKQLKSKRGMLKLLECMNNYSLECGCECDFVILTANQFYSGFNKNEFGKIPIVFPKQDDKEPPNFEKVVATLSSEDYTKEFFYLYFNYENANSFNTKEFCKRLYQAFM